MKVLVILLNIFHELALMTLWAIFRHITGMFKFKKMMSYLDCFPTEGSQYSQRRVRCNTSQPSQAAVMWLLISLL